MKQIELELKKRLLIVEGIVGVMNMKLKFICKGSGLTEEIARDLVNPLWDYYKNYLESDSRDVGNYKRLIKQTALESFISAIEAQGYYWGKHNVKIPYSTSKGFDEWDENGRIYDDVLAFEEAELKTFNPDKTLIFEILL